MKSENALLFIPSNLKTMNNKFNILWQKFTIFRISKMYINLYIEFILVPYRVVMAGHHSAKLQPIYLGHFFLLFNISAAFRPNVYCIYIFPFRHRGKGKSNFRKRWHSSIKDSVSDDSTRIHDAPWRLWDVSSFDRGSIFYYGKLWLKYGILVI